MAARILRHGESVGETFFPLLAAPGVIRGDRIPGLKQSYQRRATGILRQMNDQVILAFAQRRIQAPLRRQAREEGEPLPVPVNDVDLRNGRVQGKHVARVGIDKRIDLRRRGVGFERSEHGRGQQHIAVMAQLDDQNAHDAAQVNGIFQHDRQDSRKAPLHSALGLVKSKSKQALTAYSFQLGSRFNGPRCCHRSFCYVYVSPDTRRRPPIRHLNSLFSIFAVMHNTTNLHWEIIVTP